jgi:NitT/TauT family transport system ATP-binding protein
MTVSLKDISFGFDEKFVFHRLSLELGDENPVVLLGPSGCGKTTLLKLIAGLLKPQEGTVFIGTDLLRRVHAQEPACAGAPWGGTEGLYPESNTLQEQHTPTACLPREAGSWVSNFSFIFQEPRLLPWLKVVENIRLPMEGVLGKDAAEKRARRFLKLVSLEDKAHVFPRELSGGQRQRVSIARGFAYPSRMILMDEPFQSLDIPLRIELMDLSLALIKEEERRLVAVTHDPREAVYLGRRIIVLGRSPRGVVHDEKTDLSPEERRYASPGAGLLEERLLKALVRESRD